MKWRRKGGKRHTRRDTKTAEDEIRFNKITRCICCKMRNISKHAERHHITISGFTQGHQATIGLCPWHHRGICDDGETTTTMTAKYGPSLAKGSKTFHAEFGSNEFLLGYQDKLISEDKA